MIISERYRLMREYGLTTQYLAKRFGVHARSVRRAVSGAVTTPHWVEEMKRYVSRKIDGVTYTEFWKDEPEPECCGEGDTE